MKNVYVFVACILFVFSSCVKNDHLNVVKNELDVEVSKDMSTNARADGIISKYDLIVGQNEISGTATIGLTTDHGIQMLYITLDTYNTDWVIGTTHIYAGTYANIPLNNSGNPKIGNFPYGSGDINSFSLLNDYAAGTLKQSSTYVLSLDEVETTLVVDPLSSDPPKECFTLLIHAETYKIDLVMDPLSSGGGLIPSIVQEETSWAGGSQLSGGSWAMENEICL